jgi:hypothetical protein
MRVRQTNAVGLLRRIWQLTWQDRFLLLEAVFWLAVAGLAIAVLPFRYVGRLASGSIRQLELPPHARQDNVRRIRWAIICTAARVPWHAMCFQQGVAAQLMLRRRGIPSVLYYGAAQDDLSGLYTHVWVCDGNTDVIGGELAHNFAILATFPSQNQEMFTW